MQNSPSFNKWLKHGMTGLILGGSALVTLGLSGSAQAADAFVNDGQAYIDALDFEGGSKLKDRLVESQADDLALVYAFLNK